MTIDYSNPLHVEAARGIVRYACGRALYCGCGKVLNARDAVQWTWEGVEYVSCGECFERATDHRASVTDILDGRKLWPAAKPQAKREPSRNVAHKDDLHRGDRVEIRVGDRIVPVEIIGETSRGYLGGPRRLFFVGRNEVTGRDVKFTAAKVRRILTNSERVS